MKSKSPKKRDRQNSRSGAIPPRKPLTPYQQSLRDAPKPRKGERRAALAAAHG